MELDAVSDEIYGLAPSEFVAARDAHAKAARAAGDRQLAADIKALRKPTAVASLANQLARHEAAGVRELAELGARLRAAMAAPNGPELRRLNADQRQVVGALVQRARGLAADSGQTVTDATVEGLTATLHAAMADPDQAALLATGRLTETLTPQGFAVMPGAAGVAAATPPVAAGQAANGQDAAAQEVGEDLGRTQREARAARVDETRREVDNAEAALALARRALIQANAALERSSARAEQAAEQVERLRAELAEATRTRDRSEQQQDAAQHAHDDADRSVRRAQGALRDAIQARDEAEQEE